MANHTVVYGIVANRDKAEKIVQSIIDTGINSYDISLLSSHGENFQEFDAPHDVKIEKNWRTEERVTDKKRGLGTEKHTKSPEGTATGAVTGGVIGGALGLLAGIGALAIPGMGPFIAAGPLMAALSGIAAGGITGGIVGALIGLGIPEYEAKLYENRLKDGGILIAVKVASHDWAKRIKELLEKNGAEDVSVSSEVATKNQRK